MTSSVQETAKVRYLLLEIRQEKYPLFRELYEVSEDPRWVYLFAETEWRAHQEESPILLEASQDSPEYQWALKGLKSGALSGLILESSWGLDAVSGWARERLTVRFEGHRQGLLRFYDPLIWHRLEPGSTPESGVIERVIYWHGESGRGRWHVSVNPEPVAMSPVPTLSERQWAALNSSFA